MENQRKIIHVVAALIRREDKIFATQRGYGNYKDWWEFPGGKIEPGEAPEEALAREIREELAADISVGDYLTTVEYDYPEFHLSMACYWCRVEGGHLTLLEHEAAKWLPLGNLRQVNWLPADILVIEEIEKQEALHPIAKPEDGEQVYRYEGAAGGFDPTIQYYEDHAEAFASNTIRADMGPVRNRFLSHLHKGARILDFGCGTGRDTKAFLDLGYEIDAIDGSPSMCRRASELTGITVHCADFRTYSPEPGILYDGIWACASLLHLDKQTLRSVLQELAKALPTGGILYLSFKYGDYEGERKGRYFTDFTIEAFEEFLKDIPEYRILDHWLTGDVRPQREDERWLNVILKSHSLSGRN